jgi:glycosyltransferase involved in cell wall biosynthesis
VRILHVVTNADLGGAPRVVTELANRAVRDGQICAVASVPEGPLWDYLDPTVERFPLTQLRREIRPWRDLAALFELGRLFRAWKPDIVHLHSSKAGVLGRLAAGRRWDHVVYTIHGFDTILKAHRAFLPLERLLARRTGAVVPVSSYDRRNLEAAGIRGRIVMVRNGASDRRGAPLLDAKAAERMRDAKASGAAVVLCIARLAVPKRFDLFAEAARAFSPEEARFFWIGNIQSVDPETMPPNLEMLGEIPEAGSYANLCDLFVLLSDYEGLPMSVLEALSCGKPVLASAVGGIPEAVSQANGALVGNDTGAAAEALKALLCDRPGLDRLGLASRAAYEAEFSAEMMWKSYLKLYESLKLV